MLKTRLCELLGIEHPVLLGGMSTHTNSDMVAGVSNAGGLGILGCASMPPDVVARNAQEIRSRSDKPFGMNLLLFLADDESVSAVIEASPDVLSTAWAFPQADLKSIFGRAHEAGLKVCHMASTVPEAQRAVEAGADMVVAQGTEGGGHVGVMGTMPLVRMVVKAVAPGARGGRRRRGRWSGSGSGLGVGCRGGTARYAVPCLARSPAFVG